MPETDVVLPEDTPVEVQLCADSRGLLNLGIRINGSNVFLLVQGETPPKPGNCKTWSKPIKDIMSPSRN